MNTDDMEYELFMALCNLERLGLVKITNGDDDMMIELSDDLKDAIENQWKGKEE
jgi:hypothetical protein